MDIGRPVAGFIFICSDWVEARGGRVMLSGGEKLSGKCRESFESI